MANNDYISKISKDDILVSKIKVLLPKLFQIAEIESSRAGKIGMEVGTIRERIIVAMLIHKFGKEKIYTQLPATEPETDVILDGNEISIKTITGNGGVKAVWTVDASKANEFIENYTPKCDIILVKICWGTNDGGFFLIPLSVQKETLRMLNKGYLKMPKAGTNPRGVEFSKNAMDRMLSHRDTMRIQVNWEKEKIEYDNYARWVDYWSMK
ncbi:type II restriction endonuclease subunit R [Methanosarcina sp. MSH10X1]|uniref:ThaI family type II restriction endonuclease n=1 Tax=Methanosarcina sp. MSH10X1 TaxID=2507075 RepID=UPI000FFC6A3C|nr:ThaI family type II restriction endonuclease [Methanosarcina sp. MSH10X1]RXA15708.1 type II restriction endonuclease subunit R [Methanosarcina sp. MSH10X1]